MLNQDTLSQLKGLKSQMEAEKERAEAIIKGTQRPPQDKPILLICAVGGRSLALGQIMSKNGWNEIYNLKGGISAWKEAELPLKY